MTPALPIIAEIVKDIVEVSDTSKRSDKLVPHLCELKVSVRIVIMQRPLMPPQLICLLLGSG